MANIPHKSVQVEGQCGPLPLVSPVCFGVISLRCQPDYVDRFTEIACHRAHKIDSMPGFLGLYVLAPVGEDAPHLAVTHWQDAPSYQAWLESSAYEECMADLRADVETAEREGKQPPVLVSLATHKIVTL